MRSSRNTADGCPSKSVPGQGASFLLELPTGGTAVKSPAARPGEQAEDVGAGASVLVIEDEAALAAAVADGLTDAGFSVVTAGDGKEGLARVGERNFDVIVCDLRMPRVDGPAFYRA